LSLSDLKKKISKLLEEDEEFRYFVASKVGLLEILDRFRKYDEKFNKILEEIRELRLRANEHDRKFNEILARLDEHDRKFNEILAEIQEIRTAVDRLAISLEDEAIEVISYLLENRYGIKVDLDMLYEDGIEINIYGATDNLCVVGETAVRLGIAKVRELIKKVKILRKRMPHYLRDNVILVLYGAKIMPKTVNEASKYRIWVVTATKELTPMNKLEITEIDTFKL